MSALPPGDLVIEYKRYLVRHTRSPRTLDTYEWAFKDFLAHLSRYSVMTTADLAVEHVEGWQDTLADRELKRASRGLAASAVRGLLRWGSQRTETISPTLWLSLASVKAPDRLARPLPEGDPKKIVDHFASVSNPKVNELRDYALFLALYTTTLRISEMLQLTRKDAAYAVVEQKGARKQRVGFHPIVQVALARYVQARADDDPWLWVTFRRGQPPTRLTPPAVRHIWIRLAGQVGIEPFTTHQIRHTAATALDREGVPEALIAALLGHRTVDATRGYIDSRKRDRELMPVIGNILARQLSLTPAGPDLARLALELEAVASLVDAEGLSGLTTDEGRAARELALAFRQAADGPKAST